MTCRTALLCGAFMFRCATAAAGLHFGRTIRSRLISGITSSTLSNRATARWSKPIQRGPHSSSIGALPNVHLHIIVPVAAIFPSNDPRVAPAVTGSRDLGDRKRFVQETKHRPTIGTFTMLELPSGSAARGLGIGKA